MMGTVELNYSHSIVLGGLPIADYFCAVKSTMSAWGST